MKCNTLLPNSTKKKEKSDSINFFKSLSNIRVNKSKVLLGLFLPLFIISGLVMSCGKSDSEESVTSTTKETNTEEKDKDSSTPVSRTLTFHLDSKTTNFTVTDGKTLSAEQIKELQDNFIKTKTDHTFIGWFNNSEYKGEKFSIDSYTVSGDANFYGRWVLSLGVRIPSKDFTLHSDNGFPYGITVYNDVFYIADLTDKQVYAYNKDGSRNASKDFDVKQGGLDYSPFGIKAINGYFYIVNTTGKKIHAYNANTRTYDSSKDISVSETSYPVDLMFYNNFFYVVDFRGIDSNGGTDGAIIKYNSQGTKIEVAYNNFLGGDDKPVGIIHYEDMFIITHYNPFDIDVYNLQFQPINTISTLKGLVSDGSSVTFITQIDNVFYVLFNTNDKVYAIATGK